jgi:hypothetical protein
VRADQAAAELDAPFLDVRTRDVDLDRVHAFRVRQHTRHFAVLLDGGAADVDQHSGTQPAELRQAFLDEPIDANALQSDGVEHARRRLDDAGRGVALSLLEKQAFDGDAAEQGEIDRRGVLEAIAEAAGCGDHRVLECERADLNREIRHQ